MGYLLAALLGGFLFFNSQASPGKVENMAEAGLRKRFPHAQVDVKITGKSGKSVLRGKFNTVRVDINNLGTLDELPILPAINAKKKGHINKFDLLLTNFTWNELGVNTAAFNLNDLTYDLDALKKDSQMRVVSSGPSTAHLTVPAASLVGLMRTKLKDVENPQLTLQGDKVRITGKKPMPLLEILVPFTLTASLEARNGNEVWLTRPDVKVVDLPVGAALGKSLLGNVNPIYVFDRQKKWPFRVALNRIQARDNILELNADLNFTTAQ